MAPAITMTSSAIEKINSILIGADDSSVLRIFVTGGDVQDSSMDSP